MRSGREHKLFRRVRIGVWRWFGFFADVVEHRGGLYVPVRNSEQRESSHNAENP
jgi:hypothetical protein